MAEDQEQSGVTIELSDGNTIEFLGATHSINDAGVLKVTDANGKYIEYSPSAWRSIAKDIRG